MRMGGEELFENLPTQAVPEREGGAGAPRLREPVRDQIELRAIDLEALLSEDHPARVIWAYVEKLDLRVLEDHIKAREGHPGHPPASPRLLLALWLYATCDGVGSARALAKLCDSHDAYRWLCGGVSVNYHTLSDFRTDHPQLLDELLAENVAALAQAGVVELDTLAQDGLRVRASAGASSFGRRKSCMRSWSRRVPLSPS
jgi:transposase